MIVIIQKHEEALLKMRFDGIMTFFSELQRGGFFTDKIFFCLPMDKFELESLSKEERQAYNEENLFRMAQETYISQELLTALAEEYGSIKQSYN